ncbi:PAS domain S-box-containing protein [Hoeflea halophila]|uniref:histidine kinase n=1 Tax=Hoeflea halophila TaxID=714899 RepID=A0A286HKK5_9HYPH|nr:PAS domain S-box protein [Hoeflea halophila]SOE08353.1 PAS domain S-box-containing protein [Hoeflea halophila]
MRLPVSPESLLHALYETLPDPVMIIDADRKLIASNAAASAVFGYSAEEFLGLGPRDFYASIEDAREVGRALFPLDKATQTLHGQYQFLRKDGSIVTAELTANKILDADGKAVALVAILRDISETVAAREEHRRTESILNTALASISEGFIIFDKQDRLLLCNDAYFEIYAISAPAMRIGATFESIIRYGVAHGQYADCGKTEEEHEAWVAWRMERHRNPSKPYIQRLSTNRSLLVEERIAEDGLNVGVRTDVSILSQAKNEAERLGQIIENVAQEVYLFSLTKDKIVSANKAARDNLQYSLEELRELSAADFIAGSAQDEMNALIAPTGSAESKIQIFDTMHRRKDGSTYPCRVRLEHMEDPDDPVALAFVEDMTERLEIERALKQKEHEFETLARNLPDFIVRAKPDTTLTYVNEHYARYVGRPADEMIGRKFLDFVPEANRAMLIEHLASLSPEQPLRTSEQAMPSLTGETLWCLWSNLMVFEDGKPVELVSVGRDITQVREAQNRIARQSRELELRNNALEQFSAVVSHDLKAPLRQIRLFADMIAEDIKLGKAEDLATFSGYISQRSEAMEAMTSSLLEYSQLAYQRINPEKFQLSKALNEAWTNLSVNVEEAQASLIVEKDIDLYGDFTLLTHLYQNLFANSLKYRRQDSSVEIRVEAQTDREGHKITVEDDGIGIAPEQAERIFGVFQRLHADEKLYSGTGIGLALCRRIAESHHGSIHLDTSYRDGARFVITLPRQGAG